MSNIQIFSCVTTPIETNTYLVKNGDRGFVVDPGGDIEKINDMIDYAKVGVEAVLITHGHADHIGAAEELQKRGATVFIHALDVDKIGSYKGLGFTLGLNNEKFVPDVTLKGGETISVAGISVGVIYTPGHSKGGVCYLVRESDALFVGDTLFAASYGRTDFYDGDFGQLKNSIVNKLFRLDGNLTVYPGHGPQTRLDLERGANPVLFD